jgi:aspartate carbamoyltransferase regulatory subunit
MPLQVQKIVEGTVIDHVPAGTGSKVLQLLSSAYPLNKMAALIINAPSKKLGRKDIVKIEGVFIDEKTASRLSLIAPSASINIIRGSKVAGKHKIQMPHSFSALFKCPNPKCITNLDRAQTTFVQSGKGQLRCRHCERAFKPEELA